MAIQEVREVRQGNSRKFVVLELFRGPAEPEDSDTEAFDFSHNDNNRHVDVAVFTVAHRLLVDVVTEFADTELINYSSLAALHWPADRLERAIITFMGNPEIWSIVESELGIPRALLLQAALHDVCTEAHIGLRDG